MVKVSLLLLIAALLPILTRGESPKPPRTYRRPKGRRKNEAIRKQSRTTNQRIHIGNNATKHDRGLAGTSTGEVTVQILFDDYPDDITWIVTDTSGVTEIASGRNFAAGTFKFKTVTQNVAVDMGSQYVFNIYDSYGDGLHNAYFSVFYGNKTTNIDDLLVYSDTFKSTRASVPFTVERRSTPAPTPVMPTISPQPTHTPTTCNDDGGNFLVKVSPFRSKPEIKSADAVFATNPFCTSHLNYRDCTNEPREDCQWIFLPSSRTKGMCRIDPISKCLKMGNCICKTEDFHGGRADYAGGIVFHAPISITARDISQYANRLTYHENYTTPIDNANSKHPHDENFFISKVDFTSRWLTYNFFASSPMYNGISAEHTIAFKLHYLYMDIPLVGSILRGLGMIVSIDTSTVNQTVTINHRPYVLAKPLKKWTCTSVIITPTTLYVAGNAIARYLGEEVLAPNSTELVLGSFPGELFDFRVYAGILNWPQIREVGAKCASPDDAAALKVSRDIDLFYDRNGCDSRIRYYVTEPTTGGQTYGSGPFSTLWVAPKKNPFVDGIFYDVSEGTFNTDQVMFQAVLDEEYFFQHKKLHTYLWEKYYFENDMIAFPMEPYRYLKNSDEVAAFADSVWNNPCRYMHQNNNLWDFPLYNTDYVPKWEASIPNEVFDLRALFFKKGGNGYQYVAHEMFHEFQQTLYLTHGQGISWCLSESGASFGPASTFPGTNVIYAALPLAISYPFGYEMNTETASANAHFLSADLSFSEGIRVGHLYNSWVLWWFLAEHAGMPFLSGQLNSNEHYTAGNFNGLLSMVRLYVEAEDMDLGDVWGVFVAHYRTWDFEMGEEFAAAESKDFQNMLAYTKPPLPTGTTLENRKTTVKVNANSGTGGTWISGPLALRPGPFGWNCLTMTSVESNRYITINIAWDEGMGFQANTNPPYLPTQQEGCDDDIRFHNSMVVVHDLSTGERRYWKLKGKTPDTLVLYTGASGLVNIYILMVPTPPTDYVGGRRSATNTLMFPIPIYSYKYMINVNSSDPLGSVLAPEATKENGIVSFASATDGYWPVRCTCLDDSNSTGNVCIDPIFPARTPGPNPSHSPSFVTTAPTTSHPTTNAPSSNTSMPSTMAPNTVAPTSTPTLTPSTKAPNTVPPTSLPTSKPSTKAPTTVAPTSLPTKVPTSKPTKVPTKKPSVKPVKTPTKSPTKAPTKNPTQKPTNQPQAI